MQRTQYLNAQNTFAELFSMGVVPIVNENDTLAVSVSLSVMKYNGRSAEASRKSNLATTTPFPPSPQPWFKQIIFS